MRDWGLNSLLHTVHYFWYMYIIDVLYCDPTAVNFGCVWTSCILFRPIFCCPFMRIENNSLITLTLINKKKAKVKRQRQIAPWFMKKKKVHFWHGLGGQEGPSRSRSRQTVWPLHYRCVIYGSVCLWSQHACHVYVTCVTLRHLPTHWKTFKAQVFLGYLW